MHGYSILSIRTFFILECFFSVSNIKKRYYEQNFKNFIVGSIVAVGNGAGYSTALGGDYR